MKKADSPIEVRLSGNVTDVKFVQPEKASPPIEVKLSGNVTDVKLVHPRKADPMDVRPS